LVRSQASRRLEASFSGVAQTAVLPNPANVFRLVHDDLSSPVLEVVQELCCLIFHQTGVLDHFGCLWRERCGEKLLGCILPQDEAQVSFVAKRATSLVQQIKQGSTSSWKFIEKLKTRLRNGYPNGYPVTRATHGILVILEVKILKFLKFANSFKRRFNFFRTLEI
jgi:hypothetical protein